MQSSYQPKPIEQLQRDLTSEFPDWGFSFRMVTRRYPDITVHPSGGRHWTEVPTERERITSIVRRYFKSFCVSSPAYFSGHVDKPFADWLGDNGFQSTSDHNEAGPVRRRSTRPSQWLAKGEHPWSDIEMEDR